MTKAEIAIIVDDLRYAADAEENGGWNEQAALKRKAADWLESLYLEKRDDCSCEYRCDGRCEEKACGVGSTLTEIRRSETFAPHHVEVRKEVQCPHCKGTGKEPK